MTRINKDRSAPSSSVSKEQSLRTVPERKDPLAPSTSHEYANGDRGDKSGKNLEQQEAASGTPGTHQRGA